MDSTVGDGRFNRYYRKIRLALRLLSHGARAQTASEWSELTPDRLVTLKRRWLPEAGEGFRGPAPTSFQTFFRSSQRLNQATVFASIHQALSQHSPTDENSAKLQPSLDSGERLCRAYEIFREWESESDMEFDQAVLLARGTAKSTDIELLRCPDCRRPMLVDKRAKQRKNCGGCRRRQSVGS